MKQEVLKAVFKSFEHGMRHTVGKIKKQNYNGRECEKQKEFTEN